ncbi:NmrA/HSCARG family protein [Promicromonospora sp. NPDC023805]|uniref:NmrA/HSCARG family protein n=1 Tax=Promicromonospora sp. NPDC023805 TaxID=3154696 RepID=UPI0033D016CC
MTQHDKTILVTGATGKQGGTTARRLLDDGWPVRALVRDPESASARELASHGATLVRGDLDAPDTLAGAVADVYGVFAVSPAAFGPQGWDVDLEYSRGRELVDAAASAGVRHFVFTSIATASGPGLSGSDGKVRIEERIRDSGMRWTVLRPVRFMENYLLRGSPVDGIRDGVHRHLFHPLMPMQIIALEDIAVFAALAFGDPDRYDGRALELAGDEPTPEEAAAAISGAIGRPVRYRRIELAEAEAFGAEIAQTWQLWEDGNTWQADLAELRRLHPGLKTLDDWLTDPAVDHVRQLLDD